MKKLISYLYNRYCKAQEIKVLNIGELQRDFSKSLTDGQMRDRNVATYNYIQSGWFRQIFNEELKEYTEALFNMCETEKQRDYVQGAIKILLKLEKRFDNAGMKPDTPVNFDKFNLN